MSGFKEGLLTFIRDDYVECKNDPERGVRKSLLYQHLYSVKYNSVSVSIKRAIGEGTETDDDKSRIWKLVKGFIAEDAKPLRYKSYLASLGCAVADSMGPTATNAFIRRWAREDFDDEERTEKGIEYNEPDWEQLKSLCADVAAFNRPKKGETPYLLMEYLFNPVNGDVERKAFLEGMASSSAELDKLLQDKAWPKRQDLERRISEYIKEEAEEWLRNTGFPASKGIPGHVRVKDIPLDLVERCMRDNPKLAARLGFQIARTGGRVPEGDEPTKDMEALGKELRVLFEILKDEDMSHVVVPVKIDGESGLGLYVLGSSYAPSLGKGGKEYEPFLAILRRYWSIACEFEDSDQEAEDDELGPGEALKKNLWDLIVRAWGPGDIEAPLREFDEYCAQEKGIEAYRVYNGEMPSGRDCPQAFARFFENEWQ